MTEREWPIVEQMFDTLSPRLSEPEARYVLEGVIARLERIKANLHKVYDVEWSSTPFYQKADGIVSRTVDNLPTPSVKLPSADEIEAEFKRRAGGK